MKDGRPHRRTYCEPGQGLTAAAISGVARALGPRPSFNAHGTTQEFHLSYTVLARRYRSANFDDVVGQDAIATTLKNAIATNRTAHAYLFSGTRGVGKTSMARIFARALNSNEALKQNNDIADSILKGNDLDVIEIDGASNRGVQEARDLIASAGLAPTRCAYRIYIIDEVHMLTTPAFNALLKTMEEPPSHVKFILCTTEPHKVPATIQSRCQRFDFKSIPTTAIAQHLEWILGQEKIKVNEEAIKSIARLGNGSMRDALSLLDRVISTGETSISTADLDTILGIPSKSHLHTLCHAIAQAELKSAFESSALIIEQGTSLEQVLTLVASNIRNALISSTCGSDTHLLDLSDIEYEIAESLSSIYSPSTLTYMIALCDASSRQVKRGGTGRAFFDATIARLCLASEFETTTQQPNHAPQLTKKKRVTSKTAHSTLETKTKSEQPKPIRFEWDLVIAKLQSTAGLKRIASMLSLETFEDQQLTLSINDSGIEATNYIMSMKEKLSQVVTDLLGKKITVKINADAQDVTPASTQSSVDKLDGNDLVDSAKNLFHGTVVNVSELPKDKS